MLNEQVVRDEYQKFMLEQRENINLEIDDAMENNDERLVALLVDKRSNIETSFSMVWRFANRLLKMGEQ